MKLIFEVSEEEAESISNYIGKQVEFHYFGAYGQCVIDEIEGNQVTLELINHIELFFGNEEIINKRDE